MAIRSRSMEGRTRRARRRRQITGRWRRWRRWRRGGGGGGGRGGGGGGGGGGWGGGRGGGAGRAGRGAARAGPPHFPAPSHLVRDEGCFGDHNNYPFCGDQEAEVNSWAAGFFVTAGHTASDGDCV